MTEHSHNGKSPLRRALGLLRHDRRDVWLLIVYAAAIAILSLSVPIAVEALVGNVQGGNVLMLQTVLVLALVLLFSQTLASGMQALSIYVVELIQRRIFIRVVSELSHRLPRVRVDVFDRSHGPELVNRFFDVFTVQKAGSTLLLDGITVFMQSMVGLLVLTLWHPYLMGYVLLLLGAMISVVWLLGIGAISAQIRESYAKYAVASWLEEMVRHPRAFKLFTGPDYGLNRADELTEHYLKTRVASFRIVYRQILFSLALKAIAMVVLFGLGGWLIIRNELSVGQLVAAELIVVVLVGSFVKLGKSLESFYDLMAAVDKLGHLVDLPLERAEGDPLLPQNRPATVTLHNVRFRYEDCGEVFGGLTATINPGDRVALIGESGAGKSTLIDLLVGMRVPSSGHVNIDGIDVRSLDLKDLRHQVASVSGAEVFDGTVLDNVRLGRGDVNIQEVFEALEICGLLETVQSLPEGLNTQLVSGGAPLSSGQSKRLILARAIAGKPRLLLLDEALDQIDAPIRRQLFPALFDRQASWTLLVATRDPEIIALCDWTLELSSSAAELASANQNHV